MSTILEQAHNYLGDDGNPAEAIAHALVAIGAALERIADRLETEPVNDSTTHVRYERSGGG